MYDFFTLPKDFFGFKLDRNRSDSQYILCYHDQSTISFGDICCVTIRYPAGCEENGCYCTDHFIQPLINSIIHVVPFRDLPLLSYPYYLPFPFIHFTITINTNGNSKQYILSVRNYIFRRILFVRQFLYYVNVRGTLY